MHITFLEVVHVAVGQQTIRKQGEQNEFGQCEKLVPRQCEARAAALGISGWKPRDWVIMVLYRSSSVICSSVTSNQSCQY